MSEKDVWAFQDDLWDAMQVRNEALSIATTWQVTWHEITAGEAAHATFKVLGVRMPYRVFRWLRGPVWIRLDATPHAPGGRSTRG